MTQRLVLILLTLTALLPAQLSARVEASLLTASPGKNIYELDGHTGLRLTDSSTGLDMVVNWGIFDFDSPNFVARFVKGDTDYLCAPMPTAHFIRSYVAEGRSVTEQHLNLSPQQAEKLLELVSANLEPQNRVYRYNYIRDNCATRPFLLIEQAAGRRLIAPDATADGVTFRDEMERNHRLFPWYQFGIDLALGSELDTPLSARDLTFSPLRLKELIAADSIVDQTTVYGAETLVHPATPLLLTPMAVALAVMMLTLLVSIRDMKRLKASRWIDTVEFTLWGLCGCLICFLVFVSTHPASSPNWLLAWLNPLCFIGALLPWIKSAKKWLNCYHFANFAVLLVWLLVWKATGQHMNPAFLPWIAADLLRSATHIYICLKK